MLALLQQSGLLAIAFIFLFIWGACFGSFLNVVVYRLPAGLSLAHPPSRCPHCGHQLGARENIPVLGWLLLGGKCRWCKTPIAARYPLVEALMGLLCVATVVQFGLTLEAIAAFTLLFWLVALALIDYDTFTLPNPLTQSGLVLGLLFQMGLGFQANGFPGAIYGLMGGIGAAVLGLWLLDGIGVIGSAVLGQEAMGGGDPKLLAMIGAWLGWQNVLLTVILACALGTMIIGGAMGLGKHQRGQHLPFGPFLALGAISSLFWGDRLIELYLEMFLG
ncbi:prepilin peptidase [Picosynechococcus sp. PCC 11901]|uniref:prepilin peptidase n=1 Tax=Picosynechococcus sp. PCC 11901 TaxID=2579791 RepID=UPI0010FBF193|nr:A24 family peptidase [Picosynechococcus sp. PCC 11901]QCS48431.1 prepilin peptidase [Picosynechococcus sp. PCC 11901]